MLIKLRLALILAGVLIATHTAVYWLGHSDGKDSCSAKQVTAQKKQTTKARKTHAEIKKAAPTDADKRAGIDWLRQHTRQ